MTSALLAGQRQRFVLLLVGAVEVRRRGLELGGAGVDHLVDGPDVPLLAQRRAPARAGGRPACRSARREKPRRFASRSSVRRQRLGEQALLHRDDVLERVEEPGVDAGALRRASIGVGAAAQRRQQRPEALVGGVQRALVARRRATSGPPRAASGRRSRASGPPSAAPPRSVRSIAITSPVAFICVPMRRSPNGELVERPARDLHDAVVERRLEGGRRLAR